MCGIIAYKGDKEACKILLAGIKNLEYRGYDSVGMAIKRDHKIAVKKDIGKVDELRKRNHFGSLPRIIVVRHTGWAKQEFINKQNILTKQMFKSFIPMVALALENPGLYYVELDDNIRSLIRLKIKEKKSVIKEPSIPRRSLYRIVTKSGHFCKLSTLLTLCGTVHISTKTLLFHVKHIKTKNSFPITNHKLIFDESFARILGHITGDGGIHIVVKENKYRIFYVNNEKALLNSFRSDVVNCFGEIKVYYRQRLNRGDEIWLPSTIGSLFYKTLDYKADKKQVPSIIRYCQNKKIIAAFLQAMFDDEGFLYPSRKMVVIAQANLHLIRQIRVLLPFLGIQTNRILRHKSKNRSLMHYFSITGKQNIQQFQNKIGFMHPKKIRKLSLLLKSYR